MQLPEDPRPNINHLFFAEYVLARKRGDRFRVLDYGCGRGQIVSLLRAQGVDCVGCDVYYAGASQQTPELQSMIEQGVITGIAEDAPLPFPAHDFDVVVANMVFEHVRDFEATLLRLAAVTRRDGIIYLHFPSREVLRESHIGIPFAHWFARDSRWRWYWTATLRRLGFGHYKDSRSVETWSQEMLDWIDKYCFYRSYTEIRKVIDQHFDVRHNEISYIRFRARHLRMWASLFEPDMLRATWERLFRWLGFLAIELRPRGQVEEFKQ